MDIHKPKPWHGLREFLKEYVIIVVGVLTALAAEQAVEWLHRRAELSEARAALHAEIAADARVALFTIEEVRCMVAQLDTYEAWARGGLRPLGARVRLTNYRSSTWDVVKTGAVAHMPLDERLAYASFYDQLANARWGLENARAVQTRLGGTKNRSQLGPDIAGRLEEDVEEARNVGRIRASNAAALIKAAGALGVQARLSQTAQEEIAWQCGLRADRPRGDGPITN